MIVVDTSGWIEYLVGSPLADHFAPSLEDSNQLLVPTIVLYELYRWAKRERDETKALETVSLSDDATIVPVDTEIALVGADLALEHGLAMADALILAVARKHGADLLTCDAHFEGISGVQYTRKS